MLKEQAQKILEDLQQQFKEAQKKKLNFLLVGRTGVGKSSTVNSLIGKKIAQVGDYEATTMEIKEYDTEINQIPFKVIDTPGLCDDLEELENDYKYLEMMRSQVKQIDCMWFVSRLDETRVTGDEKRGIKLISEAFGADVWKHAVIVFTFANSISSSKYLEAVEKRTELIRKVIAKYTSVDLANNIPSVAVDNTNETTPDGEKWLGELYTKVFTQISQKATSTFLLATADFVRPKKTKKISQNNRTSRTREPQPYRFVSDRRTSQPQRQENTSKRRHKTTSRNASNRRHRNTSRNTSYYYESQKYERPRIELNQRQKGEIRRTIDANVIPTLAKTGAAIGAAIRLFGRIRGAAVGGVIGTALRAMAWFWDR